MKHVPLSTLVIDARRVGLQRGLSPSVARDVNRTVRRGEQILAGYATTREIEVVTLELQKIIQAQRGN